MIKSVCFTFAIATAVSAQEIAPVNARVVRGDYAGRPAIHLVTTVKDLNTDMIGMVSGVTMRDGIIDIDVVGQPRPDAPPDSRGFIGIAFRVRPGAKAYECFYIRPTNGRSDDQLRRNHSVQYVSEPEYPWYRLRKDSPGVYESYADMEPGKWTHLQVVVEGNKARVFINNAGQPALIVNDLKLGQDGGGVALWATQSTDAWYANLNVHPH